MRFARYALAALGFLAILAGASFNFRYGDLRFAVANRTMRHWNVVEAVKPACAAGFVPGGGYPCAGATSYTLTGPTSLTIASVATYTLTPNGSSSATVTPADASHGGIFTPSTVSFTGDNSPQTFTYTPRQSASNPGATFNLSTTNSGSLTDPSPISVTVSNILNGYPSFTGTGNSGWQDNATTHTTGGTTDPFGGTAAALITESAAANQHYIFQHVTVSASSTHEISEIVASGTSGTRNAGLQFIDSTFADWFNIVVNPATCTLVSSSTGGAGSLASTSILAIGSYCLIQAKGSLGTYSGDAQFFVQTVNGTTFNYTGDGSSNLKIYGAVLQ